MVIMKRFKTITALMIFLCTTSSVVFAGEGDGKRVIVITNSVNVGSASLSTKSVADGATDGSTETRVLANFKSIEASGAMCMIEVICGQQPSITITADPTTLRRLNKHIEVDDGVLTISGGIGRNSATIRVTVPMLERIEMSGIQYVKISNLIGKEFIAELSGDCQLDLTGKVKKLSIETTGHCEVRASELMAEMVTLEASGASKIEVSVTREICASASGVSKVIYRGKPSVARKEIDGLAVIKARD